MKNVEKYYPEKDTTKYYEKVRKLTSQIPQKRWFRLDETNVSEKVPRSENDTKLTSK